MFKLLTSFTIVFALLSCGTEPKDSDPNLIDPPREVRDNSPVPLPDMSVSEFIKNQKFNCAEQESCPRNVVRLVIVDGGDYHSCTGALIEKNKIMTSSSCLPRSLQVPSRSCLNKVFVIFPSTKFQAEEIVNCDKIIHADINYPKDRVLWKQDISVFKINKNVSRLPYQLSTLGIEENSSAVIWTASVKNEFKTVLTRNECNITFDNYLNPFSKNKNSPIITGTSCKLIKGSHGAPIFQNNAYVGVYSGEMDQRTKIFLNSSELLDSELQNFYHFSNFICSDYIYKEYDIFQPSECHENKTELSRDLLRTKMIRSRSIHLDRMREIENQLEASSKYFKYDVKFFTEYGDYEYEAHIDAPICINEAKKWISEFRYRSAGTTYIKSKATISFEHPEYIFKTVLNKNLNPESRLISDKKKTYEFEFNPFGAYIREYTPVKMISTLKGNVVESNFLEITNDCSNI